MNARPTTPEAQTVTQYFLIASRDPYSFAGARRCYDLASALAGEGNGVTLFLIQNGVLPARHSPASAELTRLARQGIRILADDFSLRERGIAESGLAPGVAPAPLDVVVDALEAGARVVWH
jgi:sulfur relay (sulfurtransferase) complex TusBCD TusD component (DsrE family)